MNNSLLNLVKNILDISDSVTEISSQKLDTFITRDIAKILGTKEDVSFYFDPQIKIPNSELITYNSDYLDKLEILLNNKGFYANINIEDLYLKKSNIDKLINNKISINNGIGKINKITENNYSYLVFNFKYTAISDEKIEGIESIAINESTLSILDNDFIFNLGFFSDSNLNNFIEIEKQQLLETIFDYACINIQEKIENKVLDLIKSLNRRLNRDLERLEDYYNTIINEIDKKIKKKNLENKDKESEISRINATKNELNKKIEDLKQKYSLNIISEPISIFRIYIKSLTIDFQLQRKKLKKNINIIWNPITKDIEMLSCESCKKSTFNFNLCDEKIHIICNDCFKCSKCSKLNCKACSNKCKQCK